MKNKLLTWIIGFIVFSGAAYAEVESGSPLNFFLLFIFFYFLVWLTYSKLFNQTEKSVHLLGAAVGLIMSYAAIQMDLNIVSIVFNIVNIPLSIINYFLEFGIIGWIILAAIIIGIMLLSKGKAGFLKNKLFWIILIIIILLIWFGGKWFDREPKESASLNEKIASQSEGGKMTPEIAELIIKVGKDNTEYCRLYSIMIHESLFNTYAVSIDGAAGLMQIMPYTATGNGLKKTDIYKWFAEGEKNNAQKKAYQKELLEKIKDKTHAEIVKIDKRFDPHTNLKVSLTLIRKLAKRNKNDMRLIAIEYNGGGLARSIYNKGGGDDQKGYNHLMNYVNKIGKKPFTETAKYYRRVYATYNECTRADSFEKYMEGKGITPSDTLETPSKPSKEDKKSTSTTPEVKQTPEALKKESDALQKELDRMLGR